MNMHGMRKIAKRYPNPWGESGPIRGGFYDMYGNIWEWVQDFYAPYNQESLTDPCCEESFVLERVLRGGSWSDILAADCRSASRNSDAPDMRDPSFGFFAWFFRLKIMKNYFLYSAQWDMPMLWPRN